MTPGTSRRAWARPPCSWPRRGPWRPRNPTRVVVDPYAEVFCRAAAASGPTYSTAARDHPLKTEFGEHFVNFQAARTQVLRQLLPGRRRTPGCARSCFSPPGSTRAPTGCRGPTGRSSSSSTSLRCWSSSGRCSPATETRRPPNAVRSPSICATTGHRHCVTTDSTRQSRRPGSPKDSSSICPPPRNSSSSPASTRLAAPRSHLAVEESLPLAADAFEAKREEELAGGNDRTFFTLVYNEQHAPALDWFGSRGWWAVDTPLPFQLRLSAWRCPRRYRGRVHDRQHQPGQRNQGLTSWPVETGALTRT